MAFSSETDKNLIVSQYPAAGTPAFGGDTVNLVISLGMACQVYYRQDINGDCFVGMFDFVLLAAEWLQGSPI